MYERHLDIVDGKVQRSSVVISVGLSNLHFVSPATSFSITAQFDEEILNSLSMVFGPSCEWAEYHFQTNFASFLARSSVWVTTFVYLVNSNFLPPTQSQHLAPFVGTSRPTSTQDQFSAGFLKTSRWLDWRPHRTLHRHHVCIVRSRSPASSQSMLHILRRHQCRVRSMRLEVVARRCTPLE